MLTQYVRPIRVFYDETWFEAVFTALDRLHDELSAPCPGLVSTLEPDLMVGWLEDIIYTAQETIYEIRAKTAVAEAPKQRAS